MSRPTSTVRKIRDIPICPFLVDMPSTPNFLTLWPPSRVGHRMHPFRLAPVLCGLVLSSVLASCRAEERGPTTAESQAIVNEEAPALSGTDLEAGGEWESCMAYPVWRYGGWAIFSAPHDDWRNQLQRIRTAFVQAGYADTALGEQSVGVKRGTFEFTIGPWLAARREPQRWKATFRSGPCTRYTARERAYIEANQYRRYPIEVSD